MPDSEREASKTPSGRLRELVDEERRLEAMLEQRRGEAEALVQAARDEAAAALREARESLREEADELRRRIAEEARRRVERVRVEAADQARHFRSLPEDRVEELADRAVTDLLARAVGSEGEA